MFAHRPLARFRKLPSAIAFEERHCLCCRFRKELRKIKNAEIAAEFDEFADRHRQEVWKEVLAPVRQAKGEPNWRPTRLMQGFAFQAQVSRILRERFEVRIRKNHLALPPAEWAQEIGVCHVEDAVESKTSYNERATILDNDETFKTYLIGLADGMAADIGHLALF